MNEEFNDLLLESTRPRPRTKFKPGRSRLGRAVRNHAQNGFKCAHCRANVYSEPILSGVQNRNHCPYCLWSRHLDLFQAGDRLAACKAPMKPIGLTMKRIRKKYGTGKYGELMIIHRCVECGRLSINRIAADDIPEAVLEIFEGSIELDALTKTQFVENGIDALEAADMSIVQSQLFGRIPNLGQVHPKHDYPRIS